MTLLSPQGGGFNLPHLASASQTSVSLLAVSSWVFYGELSSSPKSDILFMAVNSLLLLLSAL